MRSFFDWFETSGIDRQRPWLILGKGPSFSKRGQFDLAPYYTLSLNHAVREQPVTVAHIIDYNVVAACGEGILKHAEVLVLPWIPHVENQPGEMTLDDLSRTDPVLREMERLGRLLWYNLRSGRKRNLPQSPVVRVKYFSAEAALNLLVEAGVRKVRSLGVDGGTAYSEAFGDLKDETLLANSRESFDAQFREIARTILEKGVDYAPLDLESPVRVYVGSTQDQMLAVKVLEYSIRKHASISVEVFPLHLAGVEIPQPVERKHRPRTPFSFQRFLIPSLAGYRGRAIYLDSDMQVFRDIRNLWSLPFNGADLLAVREPPGSGRRSQFSVLLLNCEALRWDIGAIVKGLDDGKFSYENLMYDMVIAQNIGWEIDPAWNSLERFERERTALIHYTDMPTQPWISTKNRLGYLWMKDLSEAVTRGFISIDFLTEQIEQGCVRPSLVYHLASRLKNRRGLSLRARLLDLGYVPPYRASGARSRARYGWLNLCIKGCRRWYAKKVSLKMKYRLSERGI